MHKFKHFWKAKFITNEPSSREDSMKIFKDQIIFSMIRTQKHFKIHFLVKKKN